MIRTALLLAFIFGSQAFANVVERQKRQADCPDQDPTLQPWNPVSDENTDVVLDGSGFLLSTSVTLGSITIQNGARLVIADTGSPINIRVKYILIQSDGEFHVGSPTCPYRSPLDIALFGKSDDQDNASNPFFGRKYIGVMPTATLVIHGEYKLAWTFLTNTLNQGDTDTVIDLADDATTWSPGDRVVIASSDYNHENAEEFTLADCPSCTANQVRLTGTAGHRHLGSVSADGVDMRAEVGLLTRNIKIHGEMQPTCYADNACQFFDYDTFGGQTQVIVGFKEAHFYGIELYHMGQQLLGCYPIHFHRVGAAYGAVAQQLSVHDCFSRCVTLHAVQGLHVEDVVGYNTLGHCFFLEDGNEQDNTIIHNLGLVTKAGTLLPSDRNAEMCTGILDNVYPGYTPDAEKECMGASTFWITHPNNTVADNSAAGSEEYGFFYVFHRVPTGPSVGTLPAFHGERSPLPRFSGNRAHSNNADGLLLDRGVKVTSDEANDPAEFLSLQDYARYTPHENRDLLQPRAPAHITDFTAYKNQRGVFVRGGDVWIDGARLSDNDVSVQMMSDIVLPPDAGAHQELVNSVVVASSDPDAEWQARSHPSVGVLLCEGAVLVDSNSFIGYATAGGREAFGVGFCPEQSGQISPSITFGTNTFDAASTKGYFGRVGGIWGTYDNDGDLTQIVHDRDGSLTGTASSYAVRLDNLLMQREGSCTDDATLNAAVCTGLTYGQVYINSTTKTLDLTIVREDLPGYQLTLAGANRDDVTNYPDTTQYQPVVLVNTNYRVSWRGTGGPPSYTRLSPVNFPEGGYVRLAVAYPAGSSFEVRYQEWQQMSDTTTVDRVLTSGSSIADVDADTAGNTYYFDATTNDLYVKLVNHYAVDGYNYCAAEGCQFITVQVL